MPGTSTAAQEFAEVVYADDEWVRTEFDAIVAANFAPVPPSRPLRPTPDRRPRRPTLRLPATRGRRTLTARRVNARERSPPRRT